MSAAVFAQPSPLDFAADPGLLAHLRARVQSLENPGEWAHAASARAAKTVSVGAAAIDAALPWNGLAAQGLHEIFGDAAVFGFCASLLVRLLVHTDAPFSGAGGRGIRTVSFMARGWPPAASIRNG